MDYKLKDLTGAEIIVVLVLLILLMGPLGVKLLLEPFGIFMTYMERLSIVVGLSLVKLAIE